MYLYVDYSLKPSYANITSAFELNNRVSWVDIYAMAARNISIVHLILYQGYGSCGEYALVCEYIFDKLGFETRYARFIGIDHAWAEIKINDTWYITSPKNLILEASKQAEFNT